jgi:hypothetical protein
MARYRNKCACRDWGKGQCKNKRKGRGWGESKGKG